MGTKHKKFITKALTGILAATMVVSTMIMGGILAGAEDEFKDYDQKSTGGFLSSKVSLTLKSSYKNEKLDIPKNDSKLNISYINIKNKAIKEINTFTSDYSINITDAAESLTINVRDNNDGEQRNEGSIISVSESGNIKKLVVNNNSKTSLSLGTDDLKNLEQIEVNGVSDNTMAGISFGSNQQNIKKVKIGKGIGKIAIDKESNKIENIDISENDNYCIDNNVLYYQDKTNNLKSEIYMLAAFNKEVYEIPSDLGSVEWLCPKTNLKAIILPTNGGNLYVPKKIFDALPDSTPISFIIRNGTTSMEENKELSENLNKLFDVGRPINIYVPDSVTNFLQDGWFVMETAEGKYDKASLAKINTNIVIHANENSAAYKSATSFGYEVSTDMDLSKVSSELDQSILTGNIEATELVTDSNGNTISVKKSSDFPTGLVVGIIIVAIIIATAIIIIKKKKEKEIAKQKEIDEIIEKSKTEK